MPARMVPTLLSLLLLSASCAPKTPTQVSNPARAPQLTAQGERSAAATPTSGSTLDALAQRYVKLVLGLGEHDPSFVDAYYGPSELRSEAQREALDLTALREGASHLRRELAALERSDATVARRCSFMDRQLASFLARIDMLEGKTLRFDEESLAIYDAVSPPLEDAHFEALLVELDKALPGKGKLAARYEALRKAVEIPKDKLDAVIKRAVEGCRERTLPHFSLPEGESFTVEYVTDKPWSGYNWYKGGFNSVIQINTSLPIYIDRAIDLACHEGYPGHHVYNVMLERLVREHGYLELTVYPLFSAQSLIAEGSANYGIELAFPGDTRVAWEKENLLPLAGIDPVKAARYYRALELTQKLSYAGNVAARRYLDGQIDRDQSLAWLERYTLASKERAEQKMRFTEQYRAYVINYNVGKDLVRSYVETRAGDDNEQRWRVFGEILARPSLPSDLTAKQEPELTSQR
jgi:hypothetical protein